jgi:hypothetical protein
MTPFDPNEMIASYREAYEKAYGSVLKDAITFERGLFVFAMPDGRVYWSCDRGEMSRFVKHLQSLPARASSPSRNSAHQEVGE